MGRQTILRSGMALATAVLILTPAQLILGAILGNVWGRTSRPCLAVVLAILEESAGSRI